MCFGFSHPLVHLLTESISLPCCISEDDSWVLGCRCFAFLKAALASESASSFLMGWIVYYPDVLYFWTYVHEVLPHCSYDGVTIVFSVLRHSG